MSFNFHLTASPHDVPPPGVGDSAFIFGESSAIEDRVNTVAFTSGQLQRIREALTPAGCEAILRPRGDRYVVKLTPREISTIVRALGPFDGAVSAIYQEVIEAYVIPAPFWRLHLLPKADRHWITRHWVLEPHA
jgi:hypothetical protein